jgi:hypothetical protein
LERALTGKHCSNFKISNLFTQFGIVQQYINKRTRYRPYQCRKNSTRHSSEGKKKDMNFFSFQNEVHLSGKPDF